MSLGPPTLYGEISPHSHHHGLLSRRARTLFTQSGELDDPLRPSTLASPSNTTINRRVEVSNRPKEVVPRRKVKEKKKKGSSSSRPTQIYNPIESSPTSSQVGWTNDLTLRFFSERQREEEEVSLVTIKLQDHTSARQWSSP